MNKVNKVVFTHLLVLTNEEVSEEVKVGLGLLNRNHVASTVRLIEAKKLALRRPNEMRGPRTWWFSIGSTRDEAAQPRRRD